tara:strand:- start:904 stop:1098 length:195 start_codon:yes stop_codon:yes gene_type:complete
MYLFKKLSKEDFAKVEVHSDRKSRVIRVNAVYLYDSGSYVVSCENGNVYTYPATAEISIYPGRG